MKSKLLLVLISLLGGISSAYIYATDSDAILIERIVPRFPNHTTGEGWVRLSYDINVSGEPENVRIMDAKPRGIFERSARKALSKWRFKSAIKGGENVPQINNEIILEFKLEE